MDIEELTKKAVCLLAAAVAYKPHPVTQETAESIEEEYNARQENIAADAALLYREAFTGDGFHGWGE